jgi:hypothetical protein
MSWFFCALWMMAPQAVSEDVYVLVNLERSHSVQVEDLKDRTEWWLELGHKMLILATQEEIRQLRLPYQILPYEVDLAALHLLPTGCGRNEFPEDAILLAQTKRFAVVQLMCEDVAFKDHHGHQFELIPVEANMVIEQRREIQAAKRGPSSTIQNVVDLVDENRWFDDVTQLASWNRYSRSPEVDLARDWLVAQFEAMPGLKVRTQEFTFSGTTAYNVIATLEGRTRPDDWYVVGAHYDSISENPTASAPGAEDNASGTAGVLEMARIFTASGEPEATVHFIAYSGEEQGLHGSRAHVAEMRAAGDLEKVQTVITMDMIAFSEDELLDCLLETRGGVGDDLLPIFSAAAAAYTDLRISTSLFAFGSDHIPYLDAGIPTLLTIESDYAVYPGYHRTTDVPENISVPMGREVLKMNVAVLADMAGPFFNPEFFLLFASKWHQQPQDGGFKDLNGNNRIDVTEIITQL